MLREETPWQSSLYIYEPRSYAPLARVDQKEGELGQKIYYFHANHELKGEVVVHHAVEQQALKRYPGVVKIEKMHSLDNLRGIPKEKTPNSI